MFFSGRSIVETMKNKHSAHEVTVHFVANDQRWSHDFEVEENVKLKELKAVMGRVSKWRKIFMLLEKDFSVEEDFPP